MISIYVYIHVHNTSLQVRDDDIVHGKNLYVLPLCTLCNFFNILHFINNFAEYFSIGLTKNTPAFVQIIAL